MRIRQLLYSGMVLLTIGAFPIAALAAPSACDCPFQGDLDGSGFRDVIDLVHTLDILYRGEPGLQDPDCPTTRADWDGNGFADAMDVSFMIDHLFFGAAGPVDPCTCPGGFPCATAGPGAGGSVIVESKFVDAADTSVAIRVQITNDVELRALEVPLAIREVTPGCFITSLRLSFGDRLSTSLTELQFATQYDLEDGTCKQGQAGGFASVSATDTLAHPVSGSPWGANFYATRLFSPALPVGADPEGSLILTVDVTGTSGSFEIDTTCTGPANHLLFVEDVTPPVSRLPSFTKGVVRVGPVFYGTPTSGDPPLTVFFTGVSDTTSDTWVWAFGDGDSAFVQNPVHVYSDTGSYTVSLVATVDTDTFAVTRADYIHVNSLKADLSGSPRWGVRPFDVDFTDLSTGSPTDWDWDFGDGSFSSLQNPTNTYTDTGFYDVTLVVSNAANTDTVRYLNYIQSDSAAIPDLSLTVYGNSQPRPGFDKCYYVYLTNEGTTEAPAGGTLQFIMPSITTYVSSTPPGTVAGDTVRWVAPAVSPDSVFTYKVCVNTPVGTTAGTLLTAVVSVDSTAGEEVLTNNTDIDVEEVVTSIDPNDKVVQPEGCGPAKDLIRGDENLSYTIFFENKPEATAEAIYVLIVDTLNPVFDWGTLAIGPTSHEDVVSFTFDPFTGEMRWFFDSIMLAPNVIPPEGEGFVSYTISPKAGLPDGTVLSNRAQIRFDFENWLEAPEFGPLDLTILPCPCDCPFQSDFDEDGFLTAIDLGAVIDILFAGQPDISDPGCPNPRADFDCDGFSTALDLSGLIDHLFSGGGLPCNPCAK